MSIPSKCIGKFVYHFTHIDNLPRLMETGFLSISELDSIGCNRTSIAEPSIQNRRANMSVTCGPGGVVHDYVPLYFGAISPMLLSVIHKKNVDQSEIIYFEFPISLIERDDVVFTDASANTAIPPNFFVDPEDLIQLNWDEIDSLKWSSGDKNQRMAEMLVHKSLPLRDAVQVVVWNEEAKSKVEEIVNGRPFPPIDFQDVFHKRPHYFTVFADQDRKRQSIVTGPKGIARAFRRTRRALAEKIEVNKDAPFANIHILVRNLRDNFGCIPQTLEIVGMKSENGMHRKTVDVHTLEVVSNLRGFAEFKILSREHQDIVELAAYLHDIGKGPKNRWVTNDGVQKVDPDHAIRAMPMIEEIFKEFVKAPFSDDVELVAKLVCYHDLVGEVLGKGRDEVQIFDVVQNKTELDLLFLLSKADVLALQEAWWSDQKAANLYGRCLKAIN